MITLITGVPGTGKTAFVVSQLLKEAEKGRKIFVDGIADLKVDHYRAGHVFTWQQGTWLHIDRYEPTEETLLQIEKRLNMETDDLELYDPDDSSAYWKKNPHVFEHPDNGTKRICVYGKEQKLIGSRPYESHNGALLVIDEAQRWFRPRPQGSKVPAYISALEVHRHQGLDIWIITQYPTAIDSNIRKLCGRHIALRSTPFGRFQYEWPETGDIESKTSRDVAARERYRLPKSIFSLYKSAEVHTKTKHKLPFVGKALFVILPLAAYLIYSSVGVFHKHLNAPVASQSASGLTKAAASPSQPAQAALPPPVSSAVDVPAAVSHPYAGYHLSIVSFIKTARSSAYTFMAQKNGRPMFYLNDQQLVDSGYSVIGVSECSARIKHGTFDFFASCDAADSLGGSAAPSLSVASLSVGGSRNE